MPSRESVQYLTVTQLNLSLNNVLEREIGEVPFEGEISECTRAASGHLYLCIKDGQSQVSAVMWRSNVQRLAFKPQCGDSVMCPGTPNV